MADIFIFDPATEFEILETIEEFQEEIQRPEELKYYTLEEQLLDFAEKILPKTRAPTKAEQKNIKQQINRFNDAYLKVIDSDFKLKEYEQKIDLPWINPIYSDFSYNKYSYTESWIPLFKRESRKVPNYYPRIMTALPKPYVPKTTDGIPLFKTLTLVSEDGTKPIKGLGLYEKTKSIIQDDGTLVITEVPIIGTNDDLRIRGYFLNKRPLEIPNPLQDHPFLQTTEPSKFITDQPLDKIFPTIEAIMSHGVKTTTDPYVEGMKYLKIYDIKLSDIPWSSWKQRFPPVEPIVSPEPVQSIVFPESDPILAPSENLRKSYVEKWDSVVHPRLWLNRQEDNGKLVIEMLLSKASEVGIIPPIQGEQIVIPKYAESTPEECLDFNDSFDRFLNSGVFRDGTCVPVGSILQERKAFINRNKEAWTESTEKDILRTHLELLKFHQHYEEKVSAVKYEKYQAKPESEHRKDILTILADTAREDIDKANSIVKLLIEDKLTNNVYYDSENNFVICSHTLAQLRGDMDDRLEFYNKWTSIEEGFRVCRFCSEQINSDVLVAIDDFDSDGNVQISHDVLLEQEMQSGVESLSNSLLKLKTLFNLENVGEATLYLLLSLFQVIPEEGQLIPVISNIRDITALLRSKGKIAKTDADRIEGILGISGMVVVLQTHMPFLIPRRSFGSKIIKLNGFPRDSGDANQAVVLDTILFILRDTFKQFPNTFKGPAVTLFRAIITNVKKVRTECIVYVKQAYSKFKNQFDSAKERYVEVEEITLFPILHLEKTEYSPSERVGKSEESTLCNVPKPLSTLLARLPPVLKQQTVQYWPSIQSSERKTFLKSEDVETKSITFKDSDIRTMAKPKGLKLPVLEQFIKKTDDSVAILAMLNRILDIMSLEQFPSSTIQEYRLSSNYLNTKINQSLLRDISKALLNQFLADIEKQDNKLALMTVLDRALKRDLGMKMILISKSSAEKEQMELRAREREVFKQRMRSMNDTERDITKMLLDAGVAPYIIRNEDREIFAREYREQRPEEDYLEAENAANIDLPEEGYNDTRDYVENGNTPMINGTELQVDYGDYGDRAVRDYNDYTEIGFQYDEGY